MKSTIYLAIATYLLGAVSSWFLAKWYFEPRESSILPPITQAEQILKSITDTSGIQARNINSSKRDDSIKTNNFETKTQLNEIKNNLRYNRNLILNDSLLNAWRQFEAQHGKLLFEDGVGSR